MEEEFNVNVYALSIYLFEKTKWLNHPSDIGCVIYDSIPQIVLIPNPSSTNQHPEKKENLNIAVSYGWFTDSVNTNILGQVLNDY